MCIMKINKGLLVLSLLLLSVGKLSAEDFGYELKDGTLTILMYGGFDDWKKAGIHDKSSVTKIVIDEGVPIVPNQVFKDMRHVKSVTIPSSVTSIGTGAFFECTNLSSITFAEDSNLKFIGGYAFYQTDLTSISVPASVERIGKAAFRECPNLSSVKFASKPRLKTVGEWAFYETDLKEIVIPISVTTIGKAAFEGCRRLTSVAFHENIRLEKIGAGAFFRTSITSVNIPSSVTAIGEGAFRLCRRLSLVTFGGSNLKTIGEQAFSRTALTSFSIPPSVTTIGVGAFAKTPLEWVEVPSSVTKIEGAAFTDCKKLSSVTFVGKSELEKIGAAGFYGTALKSVEIPFSVKTIGAGSFSHSALQSVTIPASVTNIERAAFSQTSLASVIIPLSVRMIGKEAFHSCSKLTDVTFLPSKAPDGFEENVFGACFSLETIYVPEGSMGYSGGQWAKYEDIIKRKATLISSGSLTALYNLFSVGGMGSWSTFNPMFYALFLIMYVLKKMVMGL